MKRTTSISTILILLGIFMVSVFVRLPNINRPLSKHHEFVTAVSLRVLDIWDQNGAAKYNYTPVMNYSGKANKHINNWASPTGKMVDNKGNYYYVSHPPFAYIFPYVVFKLLKVKPTVLAIEIFHLLINFISALFIYLIICLLGQQKPFFKTYWSGIIGYIIYLFSAGVLWFQCNTYMSDMLVHVFFVMSVYTMLKLLMRKRFFSPKYLALFAVLLFLMIYTSWLGIFFAFSVFLYSFIKLRKETVFLPLNLITLFVSCAAVALFVFQYSSINGFDNYLDQMLNRVYERGGLADGPSFFTKVKNTLYLILLMLKGYITSYLPIFLLLGSFVYLTLTKTKLRIVFTKNGYRFLWLSTLPVILLHVFLLNYSGHDFVSLHGSLFLSVLIAILYDKLKKANTLSNFKLNLGVAFVVLTSLASYYYINRPGDHSLKGELYAESYLLGKEIKETAADEAVVFILGDLSVDPQMIFYAKRNILKISSKEEAYTFLKNREIQEGQIYYFTEGEVEFSKLESISLN